ncbi:GNAT family N-acetyltransferase [Acinetobacter sp. B5B]|uniref:GNAT family N-acetyltransferase n=1 Tax=Acinetobacter baretiae TaxID=2605383 RepID=UPI0018C202CB|nr:GNAT family N-acetyltransferase [Acinetobacter baretiae]MBF7682569.1 GNAT family N-acetyltransferase [Acinetobacter baretiae]MBF7686281.1 GNAT family N-acetyltransferase [Acinetobacter baretiae]
MAFLTTKTQFRFDVVQKANHSQITSIIDFVMTARQTMFPMLDHQVIPDDLLFFQQVFIDHPLGCFIVVYEQEKLIAVAGFKAYDLRFQDLFHFRQTTVELVKLYVLPEYRRQHVATYLVEQLKQAAIKKNIDIIYLHTHPFLKGAKDFWCYHGFDVLLQEKDPIWMTIHMSLSLY